MEEKKMKRFVRMGIDAASIEVNRKNPLSVQQETT